MSDEQKRSLGDRVETTLDTTSDGLLFQFFDRDAGEPFAKVEMSEADARFLFLVLLRHFIPDVVQ